MNTNGPQKLNIKNLIAILLGIAFVVSGIAFLQAEKANRQLSEQLRQAEEKAKTAEAEVATLRATIQTLTGTAAPSTVPDTAGQGTPALPPAAPESSGTGPEAGEALAQPPAPELLAQEINENAGLIRARVEQAWRISPGTPASLACVVKIELLPSGEVQNVSLVESSGNAAFDNSALAAVRKASPFPMPTSTEAAARFRSFNFRFKPTR